MNDTQQRKPFVKPEKRGSGTLFKNFRKKQANHPDYIGTCEIDGKKLEISAWIKDLKSGKGKFMSLAYTEPRQRNDSGLPPAEDSARPADTEPAPHAAEHPTTEPQQENFVV